MKRLVAMSLAVLVAALVCGTPARADLWKKPEAATDALLPAERAFELVSARRDGDLLRLEWVIAPGYYLYRQRLAFETLPPSPAVLGAPLLPAGVPKHDEHFGDVEIYRETLQAELPLKPAHAPLVQLRVRFQGCADAGVCYPPVTRVIEVEPAAR